jgi:glutamate dehydrogenase/leucine dehydrogenase
MVLQAIKDVIGPQEDIPAPDMNTGAQPARLFWGRKSAQSCLSRAFLCREHAFP